MPSGVVTFLDVLGWKGVYSRNRNALSSLTRLIDGARLQAEKHRGLVNGNTEVKSISDTIAILTSCPDEESSMAIGIHGHLCQWLIPESIQAELPMRGAISYGEFESQDNVFVGKAVDEAAAWYEQSDWIGVHLTPSADYVFSPTSQTGRWLLYRPPTKIRMDWDTHCVDWTAEWVDRHLGPANIKKKLGCLGPIVPEIACKFANTLNFINAPRSSM